MSEHDEASTPQPQDEGQPYAASQPYAEGQPPPPRADQQAGPWTPPQQYASPPPYWPGYPPSGQHPDDRYPTRPWGRAEPPQSSPQAQPPQAQHPQAPQPSQEHLRPSYDPGPAPWYGPTPGQATTSGADRGWGAVPYGAGAGAPPSGHGGGWGYGAPGGEPWGAPPANRATRRHRGRALAAGATAGVLAAAGVGILVGHAAWPRHTTSPTAASVPAGTGSTGTGSTGSGSSGTGSSGTGSTGSGSSGSIGSGSSPFGSIGSSAAPTSSVAAGGPSDSAAIAKKVEDGLVDIDTTLGIQDAAAAGTGMVLTSTGEILTNNHVIDGATSIRVTDIGNGKTYGAKVVGYDRTQDVAVLQLTDASGLTTVNLGNSSTLTKSEAVVGVGNAGGVGGTPTYAGGAISALNQSITASDEDGGNSEKLVGLIESNAGIQAGDSGGSLVDTSGQVIGMDTAAETATQFQAATTTRSYAIPINEAVSIARQIEAGKASSVVHIGSTALLGVEVEPAGEASTGEFGGATSGSVVAAVVSGSPAASAGIATGDTIIGVDGRTVASPSALTDALAADRPGTRVQVTYEDTSGQQHTATVTLASGPPQ